VPHGSMHRAAQHKRNQPRPYRSTKIAAGSAEARSQGHGIAPAKALGAPLTASLVQFPDPGRYPLKPARA
jgi:hypothetical protein